MSNRKMDSKKRGDKGFAENAILNVDAPFAYTEAYKALRTNMSFASMNGKYKKILITSALPNEGKSSVAINLAITLAETGARVILVDCDMRNPSIHRYCRIRNSSGEGLSTLLTGAVDVNDCIIGLPKLRFHLIPGGIVPPNPMELLGSTRMKAVLDALEKHFDYVICDTPPVSVVSDAAVLSRYCDGALLVVRQRYSTREQVRSAKQSLEAVNAKIIGTIMDRYDLKEDAKSGYGRYGYYKNYGYGYYSYGYGYGKKASSSPDKAPGDKQGKP